MKNSTFLNLLIATLIFGSATTWPQTKSTDRKKRLVSAIDSLVSSYYFSNKFSGSVLVAEDGEIVLNKEYGYQDLDSAHKITSNSTFEIASISKQFTALLMVQLKQEGKLNYDDAVSKYLPSLPYKNITIRHLLTHTSGLSEQQFFMWARSNMNQAEIYTNQFILKYLEKEKPALAFTPGSQWEYSNVGYFLLPLVMKEVTGMDYIELLQQRIFQPTGMQNSGIFSQAHKGTEMQNYVFGKVFNPRDSTFVSSFGLAWSDSIYGGVGILSNTSDLYRWDRALYSNQLVEQANLLEAFIDNPLPNGTASGYGFGWYVKDDFKIDGKNHGKRIEHNGLWPGYESSIVRYVDKDKTIIILCNQSPSAKDMLVEEISDLLFQQN